MTNIVTSPEVQSLFDRAAGLTESGGNPRLKAIVRDVLEALAVIIEKHDIDESEFWSALKFMQDGAFTQTFMAGKDYLNWVTKAEAMHRELMKEAGFLAAKK